MVKKIISGGQTGVDHSALEIAIDLHIDCGGWCPPGRACENGIIPYRFPLTETPYERSYEAPDIPRSLRTEWNVKDSDATLLLLPGNLKDDKGSNWTLHCTKKFSKPHFITDPFDEQAPVKITEWLKGRSDLVLNIAGPGENTYPGIGAQAYAVLWQVFKLIEPESVNSVMST